MNNRAVITAPIPTQKESPAESAPDVIEITISEVDRQTAGPYGDGLNCLICTALRNRGYNVLGVGGTYARMEDHIYHLDNDGGACEHGSESPTDPTDGIYYGPKVVGKVIRMRRMSRDEL